MFRRFLSLAAVLGLVLAGVPASGEGCSVAAAGDHPCCAATAPQPTESCCTGSPTGSDLDVDCACDHRPGSPTTAAESSRGSSHDGAGTSERVQVAILTPASPGPTGEAPVVPRGQSPPALFLLDCAFLI